MGFRHIDKKIGNFHIEQNSLDSIRFTISPNLLVVVVVAIFSMIGISLAMESKFWNITTHHPVFWGLTITVFSLFIGYLMLAKTVIVIDRSAKVFTIFQMTLLGTKRDKRRRDFKTLKASVVDVQRDGRLYSISIDVDGELFTPALFSNSDSHRQKCARVSKIINNFVSQ